MKQTILVLITAVTTLGLVACAPATSPWLETHNEDAQILTVDEQASVVVQGDLQTLSFDNVFVNVIKSNCAGCHSEPVNKGDVNLETYKNIFEARADIAKAMTSGAMPRRSVMDPAAKDLLLRWIAAGAPETATN